MAARFCALFLLYAVIGRTVSGDERHVGDHMSDRVKVVGEEALMSLGGSIQLTDNEEKMNDIIMKYKLEDLDKGFHDASAYLGSKHFFHSRALMNASRVFQFVKKLPKGAALHIHDLGIVDVDYVVKNITYRENLYMCYIGDQISLKFFRNPQHENTKDCKWLSVKEARHSSGNIQKFDRELKRYFTLFDKNPETTLPNIDMAWEKFQNLFVALFPMITYKPVWRDYFYEAFKQFHDDKVMYIEMRSVLPNLYDFDREYDALHTAQVLQETVNDFKSKHPDFYGMKLIYAPMRNVEPSTISKYLETAKMLQNKFPNLFAGFDLVGREDTQPLIEFADELSGIKNMSVFYHCGETNWYGSTDYNLIDAVLFGAKRLGHAYALLKHPKVMEIVKREEIALEINPISNQVLKLNEDFRNHPAAAMIAHNYPVVISSDDPGLWGALPLSHDMFITFNYIASRHADLRLLKQLAINSISLSSLSVSQKYDALYQFSQQWTQFINSELNTYKHI